MYPQINLTGGFTNPLPIQTPASGSISFNGPGSPGSEQSTSLRVVVAEKFRVAPPVCCFVLMSPYDTNRRIPQFFIPITLLQVPAPPAVASTSASGATDTAANTPWNTEYETKTLQELETPTTGAAAASVSQFLFFLTFYRFFKIKISF